MCEVISSDWNNLPDVALIEIYKYSQDAERAKMSIVSKNWNRIFETPLLWRSRCVFLGGICAVDMAERAGRYLTRFGKHLRSLSIRFAGPTFRTCKVIAQATEMLLKQLACSKEIKLKELTIFHANMEHYWHLVASRTRVVSALARFLRRCRHLEMLNVIAARLTLIDGCRLLESISRGAVSRTLKRLYMEDIFQTNVTPVLHRRYYDSMMNFSRLTFIYTNYNTINGSIIKSFADIRTMERLTLTIDSNVNDCLIDEQDWAYFKERCFNTKVSFYLYASGFRHNIHPALPSTIPMKEIDIIAWPSGMETRAETENKICALIRHIANFYDRTLESFSLHLDRHQPVDQEILYLLSKCERLRDLSLFCKMSVNTVERICKMQHEKRIDLNTLNLGVLGIDETDWNQLMQVRLELMTSDSKSKVVITSESDPESDDDSEEEMSDDSDEEMGEEFFGDEDEDDEEDEEEGGNEGILRFEEEAQDMEGDEQ